MNTETKPSEDEEFARLELIGAKRTIRIVTTVVLAHAAISLVMVAMNGMRASSWILPLVIAGAALALRFSLDRFFAIVLSIIYACLILLWLLIAVAYGGIFLMVAIIDFVIPGILLWLSITAVKASNTIRKLKLIGISDNENNP